MPTVNIPSQLVVQTAAQWAIDATVYTAKRILVTSDVFYGATDQRQFKIADGVQTWANLDYMPIGVAANASETVAGIVEEATQAELTAGTDTGATGAKLFAVPSKILSLLGSYLTTVSAAATYLTIVTAAATYQTISGLFASVMALVLTGFAAGANTAVAATDTIAQALAKFQGQINARPNENATTIATITNSTASKTTPVDADEVVGMDSANSFVLIKYSWTNIKAFLKTYSDTLYQPLNAILTAFVGLSPSNDDILQRKSGAWTNRTLAQLVTDLPGVPKLKATNTSSNSSVSDFTMTAGKSYFFLIKYLVPATDGASLIGRTSVDGGSTFASSAGNYSWSVSGVTATPAVVSTGLTTDTSIFLSGGIGNAAGESLKGRLIFCEPGSGIGFPQVEFFTAHLDTSTLDKFWTGQGTRRAVAAVNALRFQMTAGNIANAIIEQWEY